MIKQEIINQYNRSMIRFYENTQEVRRFFVKELANVLYKNVKHSENPRDKIDWFTAEEFIDHNITYYDLESITSDFLYLCTYSELRKTNENIPEIKDCPKILSDRRNDDEFKRIKETVMELSLSELVKPESPDKDFYKKLFLGRYVWDIFYQKIQETVVLEKRGYKRVLFR